MRHPPALPPPRRESASCVPPRVEARGVAAWGQSSADRCRARYPIRQTPPKSGRVIPETGGRLPGGGSSLGIAGAEHLAVGSIVAVWTSPPPIKSRRPLTGTTHRGVRADRRAVRAAGSQGHHGSRRMICLRAILRASPQAPTAGRRRRRTTGRPSRCRAARARCSTRRCGPRSDPLGGRGRAAGRRARREGSEIADAGWATAP
jgi:hypothetical protein